MEKTTDRRESRRYELRLPLRYRITLKGVLDRTGTGVTCEMSPTGLSFRCRKPLPVGAHIDMVVDWPARHDDTYPVDLQITGFVVRNEPGRSAVSVTSCKFRVHPEEVRATA